MATAKSRTIELVLRAETEAHLAITIEATYTRVVSVEERTTANVQETRQFLLDFPKETKAQIDEVAPGTPVQIIVFAGDRTVQVKRELKIGENASSAQITLTAEEVKALAEGPPAAPPRPQTLDRTAQFFSLQTTAPNYARSALNLAPVSLTNGDWTKLGLDKLFHLDAPIAASVEWLGTGWPQFGDVAWTPEHLAIDGRFGHTFLKGAGDAWLWWLNGQQSAIGIVIDDLALERTKPISIALPAFAKAPGDPGIDPSCGCDDRVRTDVSETELADNPHVYTEDPGTFCKPFSNPERILSERPFFTLFRVEQPVISPEATTKLDDAGHFDFEIGDLLTTRDSVANTGIALGKVTSFTKGTVLPAAYSKLQNALNRGRTELNASHPVQWEGDATRYQATTLARGHILEYRVRWRSNGYSLGTVSKTLTLAPRQVRRIQKIDWARVERSRRAETTQFAESASDQTNRERSYDDTVQSSLSEWARGESEASQTGVAGGIGFALGPVVIGGGAAHSNANSSSSQSGGRTVAASEEQNLRDSIRRFGDSLRRFESVVVNEVTQQETVTGTTEIVRNPNYGHSLTVIYYQILRHLRVDTEFAGVRECLFVPFAMKPFTLARIYRWRETLQNRLLDRQYLFALRYLKDVMSNFVGSTVPPGARCDLPLSELHGSIYINLAVERPKNGLQDIFDALAWSRLSPFLGLPAYEIYSRLKTLQEEARDAIFQRDHAPTIAAKWADTLSFSAGNQPLKADFTLASNYRFNGTVRIDFTIDLSQTPNLTRRLLTNLSLHATRPLTPGSIANFVRMTYSYQTDSYNRAVSIDQGVNDLITVDNGLPEASGASVTKQPDSWELQNMRSEISLAVQNLLQHLNEHIEHYHKVIWWYMDRDRIYMLLDGFYVPGTPNISIASLVEREPIAIVGNTLVFRVSAGSFLGWGKYDTPEKLYDYYRGNQPVRDPLYVSLPTDGLYAQTIMDECLALEEHRGDVDWVLDDPDPDLGTIDPSLLASRRAEPTATTPTPFPSTLINLQNAPNAPDPSGLAGVLGAVTNANAFRDMAGLAGTQAGAQAAMTAAAGLATNFGNQAAALELAKLAKADQAAKTANQKVASIKNAKDKGLVTDAQANAQADNALAAMNPDAPKVEAPHENPAINSAIETAKNVPGSTIEAQTAEGGVKVTLGDGQPLLASLAEPLQEHCAFWDPGSVPVSETSIRDGVRTAAQAERALWFDAAGNVIKEDVASQFGHLVRYWLGRFTDIPPDSVTTLQAKAVDGTVNYGQLTNAGAAAAAVNAAVASARASLLAALPQPVPAAVSGRVETSIRNARESGIILPEGNRSAWSSIFVVTAVRTAAIQLGLEAEVGGVQKGRDVLLLGHDGHRMYVAEAFRRRKLGIKGTYQSFRTTERAVQVGDIIAQDRQATVIGDVWQYDDIPTLVTAGREMHGDIVVEVPAGGDHVVTIGGNLGNSSRKRRYPVDAQGKLIVDRHRFYTQESDAGVLDPVPAANPASDLQVNKRDLSTGRIFALLSPVPLCVTIPGQQIGNDEVVV